MTPADLLLLAHLEEVETCGFIGLTPEEAAELAELRQRRSYRKPTGNTEA